MRRVVLLLSTPSAWARSVTASSDTKSSWGQDDLVPRFKSRAAAEPGDGCRRLWNVPPTQIKMTWCPSRAKSRKEKRPRRRQNT